MRRVILHTEHQRGRAHDAVNEAPLGFEVIVRKVKSKRSLDQNAYYWAMLTEASNYTGNTPAEMHEICKGTYFGVKHVPIPGGEVLHIPRQSTTKLTVEEMSTYLEWVAQFLTDNCEVDARALKKAYRA